MPKKRADVVLVNEETEERISVEATSSENSDKPRKKRTGVYIPLNEFGQLDFARIRDNQREGIEQARVALGASGGSAPVEGSVGLITEQQVKWALTYYGQACAYTIPPLINSKLRENGKPEIAHEMAVRIYSLSEEQKEMLAPDGAAALNQLVEGLPQWIKDIIFSVGPGAKFIGQLAFITAMQTKAMMDAYKIQNPVEAQPESETRPN